MNQIRALFGHQSHQSALNCGRVILNLISQKYEFHHRFIFAELYLRWVIDQSQTRNMFHQIQALITKEKETRSKVIYIYNFFVFEKFLLNNS